MMNHQDNYCKAEIQEKVNDLLKKMTLEEKIGQLHQVGPSPVGGFEISVNELKKMLKNGRITEKEYTQSVRGFQVDLREDDVRQGKIGSFLGLRGVEKCNRLQKVAVEESRLGIPLLMGLDVVHGLRTVFPIPLAESCSWDTETFEKTASIAAKESAATGINWTFAPMIDIARDARWGRIAEGAGEDTYLASTFAAAKVKGFQGNDLSNSEKIVSCAKHFVTYGAAIGGRDYNSADMSMQTLFEVYLPPFEAAINAGVASIMGSFNDLNGVPCTSNPYLYQVLLRKQLGFNGFVVSDAGAVGECVNHGTAKDRADAARQALQAGIDMDMNSSCFCENIKQLLSENLITMDDIDRAVAHILQIKYAAGLFDHPYVDEFLGKKLFLCEEHQAIARDAARKSIVLLKNNGVLPLSGKSKIAVVGELAASKSEMLGTWAGMGKPEETVCLIDGLTEKNIEYVYEPCCGVDGELDESLLLATIKDADIVVACVGEYRDMSGEAASLCNINLHGRQNEMLSLIKGQGKRLVTVLFNGRPLAIPEAVSLSDAVVEAWHLGTQAGNAVCDVLFGDYNPSGRLTTTFPNHSGECPVYYNHLPTGRPTSEIRHSCKYIDSPLEPLFPFGYGLSYTEYVYNDLSLKETDNEIEVSVSVKNNGLLKGEETVQVYVNDLVASKARPVKELKAFQKVKLNAGEEKVVILKILKEDLKFYDMQMNHIFEDGEFEVFVGHDSKASLSKIIYLKK